MGQLGAAKWKKLWSASGSMMTITACFFLLTPKVHMGSVLSVCQLDSAAMPDLAEWLRVNGKAPAGAPLFLEVIQIACDETIQDAWQTTMNMIIALKILKERHPWINACYETSDNARCVGAAIG